MLFHVELGPDRPLLPWGWVGVDLFFVLSGFLITGILLETKGLPGAPKSFYARRLLRIFPLYYLVLALVFALEPHLVPPELVHPASDRLWYFAYLQNLALEMLHIGSVAPLHLTHTWSLAVEEQYYLVWPWLVWLLPRRALAALLALVLLAAPLARFEVLSAHPGAWRSYWLVYRNTLLHVDGLAAGSLLALVARLPAATPTRLGVSGALAAVLVLSPALWGLSELARIGIVQFPSQPSDPRVGALAFSLLSVGFAGAVAAALGLRSRLLDLLLANPPVRWIGRVSYGLYVWHYVVFQLAPWESPALSVAVTFALAALSWYAFESPLLRLKRHFPSPSEQQASRAE